MLNVPRLYITQPNYYIVKSLEEFESCLDVPISSSDIIKTLVDETKQGDGEAKELMSIDMTQYLERAISLIHSKYLEKNNRQVKTMQSVLCVKPGVHRAKSATEVCLCIHQFNE
jgi:hypothetical protein